MRTNQPAALLTLLVATLWMGITEASAQSPALATFKIAQTSITGCKSLTADIVLTQPAPASGIKVTLASSTPQILAPSTVTVPKGQTTKRFNIKTRAVASFVDAVVTASLGQSMSAAVRLRPIGVASLSFVSKVEGGTFVGGSVTLECPAAPASIAIDVTSSNPKAVAAVEQRIVVPAGQSQGSLELVTSGVAVVTSQTIVATPASGGQAKSRRLKTTRSLTPTPDACLTDDSAGIVAAVPGRTPQGTNVPGITTQAAGRLSCRRNQVVTVGFFNGDAVQRGKVQTIAKQWEATGYILQFVDDVFYADVRIEFWDKNYGQSAIGICSTPPPSPLPNMHLNVSSDPADTRQRLILHEFGHALGLVHEHQNPNFDVEWNTDHLEKVEYADRPDAAQLVQVNFVDRTMASNYTAFDPDSIMRYTLYPKWVHNSGELLEKYGPGIFEPAKTQLSVLDKHLVGNFLWSNYSWYEDQYLLANWDGSRARGVPGDKLAARRGNCILMAWDRDGSHDFIQCLGNGNSETLYAGGDWNGDGVATLLVRRGNVYLADFDGDGIADVQMAYGNHNDRMLIGDWNGDGTESVAVIQGNAIVMDNNWDGVEDSRFAFGNAGDILIAGDWNGDRIDDVAVVRSGIGIILDWDRDGAPNRVVQFGNDGDARVAGDWDGDGDDDLGVLRGNCLLMDYNLSGGGHEAAHCYGNSTLYRQLIP